MPTFDSSSLALLILLAKATLLLVFAFGAAILLQRAAAGARHLLWVAILGAILMLPVLSAWSPLRLAILPAGMVADSPVGARSSAPAPEGSGDVADAGGGNTAANVTAELPPAGDPSGNPQVDGQDGPVALSERSGGAVATVAASAPSPLQLALVLWGAVALALGGWLAFGFASVRRIIGRASPLIHRSWTTPLYEIADRLGIDRTPHLVRSDEVKMPFAAGLLTPTIVLPAECDHWDDERRSAVLMHELAHIRRRDLLGHTLGRIACALYWFHPLVWSATRRLRIESERACDDLALTCGLRATNYAEHLLDIVSGIRQPRTPAVAIPMADRREFEGRMLAILDPDVRRRPRPWQSVAVVGGLAALAVVVGGAVPAQRTSLMAHGTGVTADATDAGALIGDTAEQHSLALDTPPAAESGTTRVRTGDGMPSGGRERAMVAPRPEPAPQLSLTIQEFAATLTDTLRDNANDGRVPLLMQILRADTSAELRRVAAWGLARHAERTDVASALATALRNDRNNEVRETSAWALARGEERPETIGALVEALRGDSDERVRESAAWALGSLDAETVTGELTAALSDRSPRIRAMAMWALGTAGEGTAPKAVVDALQDSSAQVRSLAAWTLFRLEDPATVPALERALSTESDRSLRGGYIRALGAIGGASAPALARLLDSRDPEVREVVVRALAGRGGGPWPMPMPRPRPYP